MYELMTHGPLVATIMVYQDFVTHSGGVYWHSDGGFEGKKEQSMNKVDLG
jgi:hypothetical protein